MGICEYYLSDLKFLNNIVIDSPFHVVENMQHGQRIGIAPNVIQNLRMQYN